MIPLTFTLEIGYSDFVSAIDRSNVEKWLLGQNTYKKFQVDQDDVAEIFWNVIFTSAEIIYVGRKQIGMLLYAQADAPWGFTFPRDLNYNFPVAATQNFNIDFYNSSDNNNYLYPAVEFVLNSLGNNFIITNITDDNREFTFTGLSPNETITVDNDLKVLSSSTGLHRLSYFNKNWLRFLPGLNQLNVLGAIEDLTFTYQFARAVGG